MEQVKIDKDIPYWEGIPEDCLFGKPFAKMEIGDSFRFDEKDASEVFRDKNFIEDATKKVFRHEPIANGGFRIWRTA